jgi:hypothetical protein
MSRQTVRDRLWLWGMKVNVLQAGDDFGNLGFADSTMTTEDAIAKTGIRNVLMAGGLEINQESLDSMPSAERIICKWSIHRHEDGKCVPNQDECMQKLSAAKELASRDTRIQGFHCDDFSTGSIDSGIRSKDVAKLQFANLTHGPALPLAATIYTMSIDRPELPDLLRHFGHFLVPLWHSGDMDTVPGVLDRLADMTGGAPTVLCLYTFNFGTGEHVPAELMQQHLDLAERLLHEQKVAGVLFCGTCMMDLDWPANDCLYRWIDRVGDMRI